MVLKGGGEGPQGCQDNFRTTSHTGKVTMVTFISFGLYLKKHKES